MMLFVDSLGLTTFSHDETTKKAQSQNSALSKVVLHCKSLLGVESTF